MGLFGGTFNPIHFGHLQSLVTVLDTCKLDRIIIMPTHQNPLRAVMQGPSPRERFEMVKIGMADLDPAHFELSDLEISRAGMSYTIDTIESLKKSSKNTELSLIIGVDNLKNFHEWKNFSKILSLAHLVVTSRPGNDLPKSIEDLPGWLREMVKSFNGESVKLKTNKEIRFVKLNDVPASSTDIRRKIRQNEDVKHLIPEAVFHYIKERSFYNATDVLVSDYSEMTRFCAKIAYEKGGLSINAYDVRELTQPAEFTLAVSGTSTRHTRALCEHIMKEAKERYGVYPQGTEGLNEGRWVVIDYGALMIHIFYDFVRSEYKIEELWSSAPRLTLEPLARSY